MKNLRGFTFILVALMIIGIASFASAKFPERPVTLVCPFGVGSASDTFARALKEPLSKALGVPVVIVNVEGAGGLSGSKAFTALMGGHIKAMLYKMESVAPQVVSGVVKPLLVMAPERINDPL